MILHRLRLTNFRGVADREITFPEQGVVVICGPNEIGKSSMLEGLDLLLAYRDRSTHRDVKAVKPAHADVGAQVEAEISTGPYRFVYRKRFHKKAMTELSISAPKREQLSGDDAHERVEAMLAETVDTTLWDAQRVLQAASTNAVNLSGSDALSRALDAAAGDTDVAAPGDESLLVDRVDAEYLRYFTGTGRPTGAWKSAIERVTRAEAEVARCVVAVEEVDDRVARHEELTAELRALEAALTPAVERLSAARIANEALADLREQLRQARLVATAASATASKSAQDSGQRQQLAADCERRGETLAGLGARLAEIEEQEAAATQSAELATAAAEQSAAALECAQQRFDTARAAAQACVARGEADKMAAKLARVDEIEKELDGIAGELATITLDATALASVERRWAEVQRLEAQLRADAATVEFTAPTDLAITVDGVRRELPADQSWTQPASAAVVVEVPGVLTVRIDPGASAVKLHTDLAAAQQLLSQELAAAGSSDVEAARTLDVRRRALVDRRAIHSAKLEGLLAGEDVENLRIQLAELRVAGSLGDQIDPEAAAAELAAADEAQRTARADADSRRKAAAMAAAGLTAAVAEATVVRDRLKIAGDEFVAVREQLATMRSDVSDDAVAAKAAADAEVQQVADAAMTALAERYAAADPDAVEAEQAAASEAVETITGERDATTMELRALAIELSVIGSEGRQGQLDEAQAELERARSEHTRVQERAAAAQMLRSTMIRHRDNTRQRYVEPYRKELEQLGRQVFGSDLEVDVDTELTIQTRTLDGCTVPYSSLSGGAKEQLGILARLAGAALVAKEDTVPVVLDDALGFSDPDRLASMAAVLNDLGSRGQVIVLTCTRERFDGVTDAEVIELSA